MKLNNCLIFIVFFLFANTVQAMWVKISDCELINKSAIIVQAELVSVDSKSYGTLNITDVLKGNRTLGSVLLEQPSSLEPISSTDIIFSIGQKGIWFLNDRKGGEKDIYYIDSPQRYWEDSRIDQLRGFLKHCKD